MSKYKVISDWMSTCDKITTWLYFNAILMENNQISINPISENKIEPYIDGSSLNELIFTIDFIQLYDTEQSNTNMHSIEDTQDIIDWVKSQTTLPDFGDGHETESVEVNDSVPGTLIDQDLNLCKYQFTCKVIFYKK